MTHLFARLLGLCAGFVMATAASAQSNLLTNGGFENGVFNPPNNDTVSLQVGSTQMTGWTVTDGSISWIGPGNPFRVSAIEGTKFLDLTDYRDSPPYGGVSQNILTTAGSVYLLSFKIGSSAEYGQPVSLTASAGSTQQVFTSNGVGTNLWLGASMYFVASANSTAITLRGLSGSQNIGLDDVSVILVTPVPEPGTGLLMALGLAGLGSFAARQRRSA